MSGIFLGRIKEKYEIMCYYSRCHCQCHSFLFSDGMDGSLGGARVVRTGKNKFVLL